VQKSIYFTTKQGCSVRGSIKSLGSRTFTNFNELEKCHSGFGQSSTNFLRFDRTLQHVSVKMIRGQQPPPVQSHSFLAVKITCSMVNTRSLSVICTRPGVSLFLGPDLSHIFKLLRIYTTRHLHAPQGSPFSTLQ
jgi:hypothetical protein